MFQSSNNQVTLRGRSFELHKVLKNYKKFQKEKLVLKNRINNMNFNKQRNLKKTDQYNKKLDQLTKIRSNHINEKQNLRKSISESNLNDLMRKKQNKMRIKQQQRNVNVSRIRLLRHKDSLTHRVRSDSKNNSLRISMNKQKNLQQKVFKNRTIRHNQILSRSRAQQKISKKLEAIKLQSQQRLFAYTEVSHQQKLQIQAMKQLEKSILVQFSNSLTSLKNSRSKLKMMKY